MEFNRTRAALLAAVIICFALIIFTINNRNPGFLTNSLGVVVVPVQGTFTNISNWVGNTVSRVGSGGDLAAENSRLLLEIENMQLDIARLELLERNNIELAYLLEMSQRYPRFDTTGSYIISRDSNNWNSSFIIDKGTNHGIEDNMVVVAQGGLVGRVVLTGSNWSRVTPIIDDTSTVGAMTSRTGDFGFVRGDISLTRQGLVRIEMNLGSDIIEGDDVITSTYGDIFPPGIRIGTITEILESGPRTIAILEPEVDFTNLNAVLIIYNINDDSPTS